VSKDSLFGDDDDDLFAAVVKPVGKPAAAPTSRYVYILCERKREGGGRGYNERHSMDKCERLRYNYIFIMGRFSTFNAGWWDMFSTFRIIYH